MWIPTDRCTCFQRFGELRSISLSPRCIDDPDQLLIIDIASPTLFGFDVRMLELDYPSMIGSYICDVFLTVFSPMDKLLPVDRELSFPIAVPFSFVLPPRVTEESSLMSPVRNSDLSALCNHRLVASWTLT